MNQKEELVEMSEGKELEMELLSLFETTSRLEYELELVVSLRED